jgi:D-alanyl-D-alanine carboxypeptidase
MKKILIIVSYIIILSGCSTNPEPKDRLFDEDELKQIVQSRMNEYNVPGIQVCVMSKSRDEIYNLSLGYSDLEMKTSLKDNTQFKAGSNTKSFTAFGILLLVQDGLVELDKPVTNYIEVKDDKLENITVHELMNMHSGLRGYINDDDEDYNIDLIIKNPSRHFTPAELLNYSFQITGLLGKSSKEEFHYTNTNYILLGMIIESVSGMSYPEFIENRIIEPLGLSTTYIPVDNNYDNNVAKGYHLDMDENTVDNFSDLDLSYVWSAGAIISTANDLCKWMQLIGGDRVVSGNTLEFVYTGLRLEDEIYYTSGLINEPGKMWHNGTVLGYHSEMCYLKDSQISIAVLSNCTIAGVKGDPVREIMDEIIELVNE